MNNTVNVSTGKTPFEINYGFSPRMDYLSSNEDVHIDSVEAWVNTLGLIHFGIEVALNLHQRDKLKQQIREGWNIHSRLVT